MNRWIRAYWAVSSIVVLSISGSALLGHVAGFANLYQWRNGPNAVGMAINTSICLLLLGAAVGVRLLWKEND